MSIIDTEDPRQVKLYLALDKLMDDMGEDTVGRAYSEAMRPRIFKQWTEKYGEGPGYTRISAMLPFPTHLLYSDNVDERDSWENQRPPGADHDALVGKDGTLTFFTQPYKITMETLKELIPWCEQRGLTFDISTGAQHFATNCVLIKITKEQDTPQEPLKPLCEWPEPDEHDLERLDQLGREGHLVAIEEARMVLQKDTLKNKVAWVPHEQDPFGHYERIAETYGTTSFKSLAPTNYYPETSPTPFRDWILSKTHLNDLIGDLAKDMVRDASLPETHNPTALDQYLYSVRPSAFNVRNALAHAWLAFRTGFKELPVGPPSLHLPKAYALISGVLEALNDVEPEIAEEHKHLPTLLKTTLSVLNRPIPTKFEHKPDTQQGALSTSGHIQMGAALKQSSYLLSEAFMQARMTYLDDDKVVETLHQATNTLRGLRSRLEDVAATDHRVRGNWEVDWYYGRTDEPLFTRADHLLLGD